MKRPICAMEQNPIKHSGPNNERTINTQGPFPTKNPEAFQLRDSLKINGKCSKEDSNLHRLPY